jgi:hypothetical protein
METFIYTGIQNPTWILVGLMQSKLNYVNYSAVIRKLLPRVVQDDLTYTVVSTDTVWPKECGNFPNEIGIIRLRCQ